MWQNFESFAVITAKLEAAYGWKTPAVHREGPLLVLGLDCLARILGMGQSAKIFGLGCLARPLA